jgi:hypothetical protein
VNSLLKSIKRQTHYSILITDKTTIYPDRYGFLIILFSVMMAAIYLCGVISKAGLVSATPLSTRRTPLMLAA